MARPAKFSDDELLDRAMMLLWQRGWAATSIRDLEASLDVKAPSIYRRFGSKDGLAAAAIERYIDRIVWGRVSKYLTGADDPIANIEGFLCSAVSAHGDDGRLWGCLLTTCSIEHGTPGCELAAAIARGFAVIESGLRREAERAAELGRLADGVDVDDATATMVLAMQGLMAMSRRRSSSADLITRARSSVSVVSRRVV